MYFLINPGSKRHGRPISRRSKTRRLRSNPRHPGWVNSKRKRRATSIPAKLRKQLRVRARAAGQHWFGVNPMAKRRRKSGSHRRRHAVARYHHNPPKHHRRHYRRNPFGGNLVGGMFDGLKDGTAVITGQVAQAKITTPLANAVITAQDDAKAKQYKTLAAGAVSAVGVGIVAKMALKGQLAGYARFIVAGAFSQFVAEAITALSPSTAQSLFGAYSAPRLAGAYAGAGSRRVAGHTPIGARRVLAGATPQSVDRSQSTVPTGTVTGTY